MSRSRHATEDQPLVKHDARRTPRSRARWLGTILNLAMRGWMAYVTVVVLANPDDPRWADVGLGIRTAVILALASMVIPAWHIWRRRGLAYPVWMDNLYLSTFVLDLVGNYFDLYDTYATFHLIPHAVNTGAFTVVTGWLLGTSMLSAFGLANTLHILWEAQEAYGDLIFGTQNVLGLFDTINDLLVGVVGAAMYCLCYYWFVRRAGREPPRTKTSEMSSGTSSMDPSRSP